MTLKINYISNKGSSDESSNRKKTLNLVFIEILIYLLFISTSLLSLLYCIIINRNINIHKKHKMFYVINLNIKTSHNIQRIIRTIQHYKYLST